jgi:hypothetical protein
MNTKSYYDKFGLVNAAKHEVGAENSLLWTFQNYLLNKGKGNHIEAHRVMSVLVSNMETCRIKPGFFHQTPVHQEREFRQKDGYMSPDQLITFMMAGFLFEKNYKKAVYHKEIWKEIRNQGYIKYNNLEDGKLRLIHPRDWILYFSLNNQLLGQILMWALVVFNIIACLNSRDSTTGKLLAWTKSMALKDKFLAMRFSYWICTKIIERTHGSWSDVFCHFSDVHQRHIYFPLDHPNSVLAQSLY